MAERFDALCRSGDALDRVMAVYAKGRFGVGAEWPFWNEALEDESPDVRKIAVEALHSVCHEDDAWLALAAPRLKDEHRDVRLAVVDLLGNCSVDLAAPLLFQALNDTDDWVRIRAVESLGVLGAASAVSKLRLLLDDPNRLLAIKSIEALGVIGGQEAFEALFEQVDREDPEIQSAAEEAIFKLRERGRG